MVPQKKPAVVAALHDKFNSAKAQDTWKWK